MDEHIKGTYFQARRFSHTFDRYGITAIAAIAHDLGKKSSAFVQYLKADKKIRGSVQHAIGGVIALCDILQEVRDERLIMAALIVAGHHTGMPDLPRLSEEKVREAPQYLKAIPELSQTEMQMIKDILKRFPGLPLGGKSDRKLFLTSKNNRKLTVLPVRNLTSIMSSYLFLRKEKDIPHDV
ncbi:CRISPR-associated endonuclease Cas3'' [Heyndrickxia faecalis]|uniref:CRISPR-associated endonuclease Cas3'' n=3 Tax=Heyndrickxia TaxID=2837504 RepID=UPI003D247639